MIKIIFITLFTLCIVNTSTGSALSSLGVEYTDVTVKTLLSKNGFSLRTRSDPKTNNFVLDQIVVNWNGKQTTYTAEQLPYIVNPNLTNIGIYSLYGKEDTQMILVISFNWQRAKDNKSSSVDAARFLFNDGKLSVCKIAEAVDIKNGKWKLSKFDHEKKILFDVMIDTFDSNPYLE